MTALVIAIIGLAWLALAVLAAFALGRATQLRDRSIRLDRHGRLL